MRTINLIPKDYEGNPREALGYTWSKYVAIRDSWTDEQKDADRWGGVKADHEKSTPGEDIHGMTYAQCLEMLQSAHGRIAIRHGFMDNTATTTDGETIQIPDDMNPVATINGMWCGGPRVSVFAISDDAPAAVVEKTFQPAGDTLEETAAREHLAEKIELDEMDRRNRHLPGWCSKFHSFCFGDCES
jgi:hypothetical protein